MLGFLVVVVVGTSNIMLGILALFGASYVDLSGSFMARAPEGESMVVPTIENIRQAAITVPRIPFFVKFSDFTESTEALNIFLGFGDFYASSVTMELSQRIFPKFSKDPIYEIDSCFFSTIALLY